ncbi:hypothetical protein [Paraburkholderia strydomiana]
MKRGQGHSGLAVIRKHHNRESLLEPRFPDPKLAWSQKVGRRFRYCAGTSLATALMRKANLTGRREDERHSFWLPGCYEGVSHSTIDERIIACPLRTSDRFAGT